MYLQLFFQLTSFHIQISSQLSSFLVWFFSPFLIQHYFGILSVTQCSFQLIPFQLELSSALDQYFRWMPYSFQTQLSAQPVSFLTHLFSPFLIPRFSSSDFFSARIFSSLALFFSYSDFSSSSAPTCCRLRPQNRIVATIMQIT